MASSLHPSELDTDSVESTPRSENFHAFSSDPRVRFMCSFGGKILPRPHDNQLRYVGGETRIVAVHRSITYSTLLTKLAKLSGIIDVRVKYQLPNEDLDALISVTTDEDLENMLDEYDRLAQNLNPRSARLRLFLFSKLEDSRTTSISSLLDGSTNREHWFFDALNAGKLERGRSEASSIVSEVPDYLFGLENSDETQPVRDHKFKNRHIFNDSVSASDPGSPAPVVSSPYCSTSSSVPVIPPIPDLPPVKTKPEIQEPVLKPKLNNPDEGFPDKIEPALVQRSAGYPGNQPATMHYIPETHYSGPSVPHVPFYYVQQGLVQPGNVNVPVQQVQMRPYVQQYQVPMAQMPVGYPGQSTSTGINQVYAVTSGAPMRPIGGMEPRGVNDGVNANHMPQVYYHGVRGGGPVQHYPGPMIMSGEELQRSGSDMKNNRLSQS